MTSQVSDVGVAAKAIRRTVAAHGIVSFFFNVALLALMVNVAASAILNARDDSRSSPKASIIFIRDA
jgi:Co/Zn/Cd efflux system component